ncbi:OmpA family protein [Runella aurantiaca]|uniref:OmpA family protein n=1 Tax=Runella aurantiaca TaxID=2282308 RepID=UPI001314D62F|nr:OmpA family protein [Runella aurantiaca]
MNISQTTATADNLPIAQKPELTPVPKSELDEIIADVENNVSVTNRKVRLSNILFDIGSNKIQSGSFSYLDSIAFFLVKIPTITVEISGFSDNTGNASANLQLSESRSKAVRDYLTRVISIAPTRIKAVGYGQTGPIATNNTEAGRALNRRVELKFVGLSNDVYTLQFINGQRTKATFIVSSADNKTLSYKENANSPLVGIPSSQIEFIEYPDGTRRRVGSTVLISPVVENNTLSENNSKKDPPSLPSSTINEKNDQKDLPSPTNKNSFQLNFLPAQMLGEKSYTALYGGYGHTIGLGGSAQFDYWLAKWFSVGAEGGYLTWRTQVNVVENRGEQPYRNYSTQTDQTFLLAHIGVRLGKHFYLMPQGGINLLTIKVKDDVATNVFKSYQVSYGGAIGYLLDLSPKVNLNAGLFYRNSMSTKTVDAPNGFDAIQYVGFRLGLQFSR